jgi:hypothetical protein
MIIISARFVRAPAVINRLYFAITLCKEDTSSTDSNGSPNALKVTPRQKKKKKYRKKQNKTTPDTTKQLKRHSALNCQTIGMTGSNH